MNLKNYIKPMAAFALICGAPLLQAQVLGGGLGGGLNGAMGGTLGNGMGSLGGNGQGSVGGNLGGDMGGALDHGDALRRHAGGAVERTRDMGSRAHDRVSSTRDAVGGTASSAASSKVRFAIG